MSPADRVSEMIAFYNADPRRTMREVGEAFGISTSRARQLLTGQVERRLGGTRRKDGSAPRSLPPIEIVRLPFLNARELKRRRERTRRALEKDPDVLRYRAERERRSQSA